MLAEASGLSRQRIKQLMQKGAVWVTHGRTTRRLRRADKALQAGDELHLYYDEAVLSSEVPSARIIADEEGYSVWYKPHGMLCQGSKWGDHCTINRWAEQHLTPQRPAFIVHRLDRAASGLILLAHRKKVAAALAELFQRRMIEKRYQVLVEGRFAERERPLYIDARLDGRKAASHVRLIHYDPIQNRSLLDVKIDSGRKHQIRRHLAGIGLPVVGDRLYGRAERRDEELQLTACYLAFKCPLSGERREYILDWRQQTKK